MRLLGTKSYRLDEFYGSSIPPYAILSHTWGQEEISFQDMQYLAKQVSTEKGGSSIQIANPLRVGKQAEIKSKAGYQKILSNCAVAAAEAFNYIWIDTCCIDKSSSAELSEAINSMFRWHQEAEVCYAYLSDVHQKIHGVYRCSKIFRIPRLWRGAEKYQRSRCSQSRKLKSPAGFEEGGPCMQVPSFLVFSETYYCEYIEVEEVLTLRCPRQELLAPSWLIFFTSKWEEIGTRTAYKDIISHITGIPSEVLDGAPLEGSSIAQRMSWASKREATREEDVAYSLMGIFDVHMPLLYGEGDFTFIRLQEEIMKRSDDQTIFTWGYTNREAASEFASDVVGLLAPSPAAFAQSGNIIRIKNAYARPFAITNRGISLELPRVTEEVQVRNVESEYGRMWVILDCEKADSSNRGMALCMQIRASDELPGTAHRVGGTVLPSRDTLPRLKNPSNEKISILLKPYTTNRETKAPAISVSMY